MKARQPRGTARSLYSEAVLTWPSCETCRRPALQQTPPPPAPTAASTQAPAGPASAVTCPLPGLQVKGAQSHSQRADNLVTALAEVRSYAILHMARDCNGAHFRSCCISGRLTAP